MERPDKRSLTSEEWNEIAPEQIHREIGLELMYSSDDALAIQRAIIEEAARKILAKRKDYSSGDDPYRNFRIAGIISGTDAWRQVLGRLGDKLQRVRSITEQGGKTDVTDETLMDTFADAVNYVCILAGVCDERLSFFRKEG